MGLVVLVAALAPVLTAIWGVRWFVTQDGSAHLYNAHIIAESLGANSPFARYFLVRWEPLPNWSGHLVTAIFVSLLPAWAAGPAVTTLTLVGFVASIVWLRVRVAGSNGLPLASVLAVLLALNLPWLLGFTSFLLGACLFPITLGVWWGGRDRFGWGRTSVLFALIVLGYFCHLVSLGLTAFGLVVLALATPGNHRRARLVRTLVGLLPLVPLGLLYRALSQRGGAMRPVWKHLDPFSLAAWGTQLGWVDPITLVSKKAIPLTTIDNAPWFGLFAPMMWLIFALILMALVAVRARGASQVQGPGERTGWVWLGVLLLVGGILGPDSLGASHGEFLQQRVVLLGLVALVPILNLTPGGWPGRLIAFTLVVPLAMQSAIVWDYALTSRRMAGAIVDASPAVDRNQRVATLLIDIRTRFRANPLLHADNLLGIGTGNIIWSDYETRYYYFPVQFKPKLNRPLSSDLESIANAEGPANAARRAALWQQIITQHAGAIDAVVVWGSDPQLDAISRQSFETVYRKGEVRVLKH